MADWLDIIVTILGLIYIWLEYRVSIWLWVVGIIMPALDIILYWRHGLYGDSVLSVYYLLAAVYGLVVWKFFSEKKNTEEGVSMMPVRLYLPSVVLFFMSWYATWYLLVNYTNSTVPVLDGFTNAMSMVALWALSRKYCEQWLFWIVTDLVCCYLYVVKGLPFKAFLYGLYVVIAVAGYVKWKKISRNELCYSC